MRILPGWNARMGKELLMLYPPLQISPKTRQIDKIYPYILHGSDATQIRLSTPIALILVLMSQNVPYTYLIFIKI